MSGNRIERTTKTRPCMVCGHKDWCCRWTENESGHTVHLCMRQPDAKWGEVTQGAAGTFVRIGTGQNSGALYKSLEDFEAEKAEWVRRKKEENQRNRMNASQGSLPESTAGKHNTYGDCTNMDGIKPAVTASMAKDFRVENEVLPVSNELADRMYRSMADHLILEPWHREYLRSEGWTDGMLSKYHVVSFPERDFTRFRYRKNDSRNPYRKKLAQMIMDDCHLDSLKGLPGAYRTEDGRWSFAGYGGIAFFMPDVKGRLYRMRIRLDFHDVNHEICTDPKGDYFIDDTGDKIYCSMKGLKRQMPDGTLETTDEYDGRHELKGKYRNFSSYAEDPVALKEGIIKNAYTDGCGDGNRLGFYFDVRRDDMHIAYITEGEKKAAFANYVLKAPFISVPGVDSWPLLFKEQDGTVPTEYLKSQGVNVLIVAYDADKETNKNVMDRQQKTITALKEAGFTVGVAEWDRRLGKGIDDLCAAGYKPRFVCA